MNAISVAVSTSSTPLLPAASHRSGFLIQNPSTSAGTVWVSLNGAVAVSAPPCIEIKPGDSFSWVGLGPL